MYTYKRFRTSKPTSIISLIALALVAWGILGLTGTPLAKKTKTVYEVRLDLNGVICIGESEGGYAMFPATESIQVGTELLDLTMLSLGGKNRKNLRIGLFLEDTGGAVYQAYQDGGTGLILVTKVQVPGDPGFTLVPRNRTADVSKHPGKGNGKGEWIGTVLVGDAVYTPK